MADEMNEIKKLISKDDDEIFDEYINRGRFNSKFWLGVTLVVLLITTALLYKFLVLDQIVHPEELKASIELFEIDSQWVVLEEIHEKEYHGVVMVPQISFRIRNVGQKDLRSVYLLGVFRLLNSARSLGEDYSITLKESLQPGGESDRVTLTSSHGYRARSKEAFVKTFTDWRLTTVDIFAKSGGAEFMQLKQFYIIRRVEGMKLDVEIKMS